MGIKIALSIGLISCISVANAADKPLSIKYSSEQYFKNYALSTCIADGYKSEEVAKDAAAAARGYLELGSYPLEAHTEATLLGREFLKRQYKSVSDESLTLMKCVDFYHSNELDSIAWKYRLKKQAP